MKPFLASADINAPPEVVWTIVTDLDASPSILSGVKSIERLGETNETDNNSFVVGTRWLETRVIGGREDTQELYVTAIDSQQSSSFPKSYTVESDGHGAHYMFIMKVESASVKGGTGRGSRLTMEFDAQACSISSSVMMLLFGTCIRSATEGVIQTDLDDITREAEKRSSSAPVDSSITVTKFLKKDEVQGV